MQEFMKLLRLCNENRVNVEMLCVVQGNDEAVYGVRLRPWSNKPGAGVMVLGAGPDPTKALAVAVDKAKAGRWEPLDFARRPWATEQSTGTWHVG